jgi:hypothetical protein
MIVPSLKYRDVLKLFNPVGTGTFLGLKFDNPPLMTEMAHHVLPGYTPDAAAFSHNSWKCSVTHKKRQNGGL